MGSIIIKGLGIGKTTVLFSLAAVVIFFLVSSSGLHQEAFAAITITARPFSDINEDKLLSPGDFFIGGWTITLNGTLTNGTTVAPISIVTPASCPTCPPSTAVFTNVLPGTYTLTSTLLPGYVADTPTQIKGIVVSTNNLIFNFGNISPKTINARPFNDSNGNGMQNTGEPQLNGWTVSLTGKLNNGTVITPKVGVSANLAGVVFAKVYPGTYSLIETNQAGFTQSTPNPAGVTVALTNLQVIFGNILAGTITAMPFNDTNKNGVQDAGESQLPGWTFTLTGTLTNGTVMPSKVLVSNPTAVFSNLSPGTYTLTETGQSGFANSTANPVRNISVAGNSQTFSFGSYALTIPPPSTPVITTPSGITNNQTQIISGTSDPTVTINVYSNSTLIGSTISNSTGQWSLITTPLAQGANIITATATNSANVVSPPSGSITITVNIIPLQLFSIDLYRGDVNQTTLATFFNKFTTSKDFVYPVSNANPINYHKVKAGNFTLGISQLAQTDSIISQAKAMHVTHLVYDLEPGAGAEYNNYVNSTATVANKVHAAGLKLILEPRWLEIQSYGTQIAPYADMITMQLPYPLSSLSGGYVSWVSHYSTLLKNSAGHPIVIGEQMLTKQTRGAILANNFNPVDIAVGYNNTKQYISYFQLFYFNQTFSDNTNTTITKDVIPYLSKFYKGIGIPGI